MTDTTGQHNIWYSLITIMIIVFVGRVIMRKMYPRVEGFAGMERFQLKENDELFDSFYVSFYDQLMYSRDKLRYEFNKIQEMTDLSEDSRVLDMGSGTGHHLHVFSENGVQGIGMDKSEDMVEYARRTYPDLDFQVESMESANFPAGAFSHILCLYFTIYYVKNKQAVFANCFKWLSPGGYLVLHLVNKNKFSPVVPGSNKIRNTNVQKYEEGRITKSIAKLDKYNYTSNFVLEDRDDDKVSSFIEKFTDHYGKVRENKHTLYMETQTEILKQAYNSGFVLDARIDLGKIGYNFQYLYIFQKPE